MKKTLITLMAVGAASTMAFAQGTVSFNNNAASIVMVDPGDGSALVPAPANGGFVQLLWAPVGTTDLNLFQPTLNVAGANITENGAARFLAPGRFAAGVVTIPSISPGGAAALVVRGWLGTAPTWADAVNQGAPTGWSPIFTIPATGDPTALPPGLSVAVNTVFPAGMVIAVPEPTSMALAGLGAAALLIFRRRK